jgi:hypothetical protein
MRFDIRDVELAEVGLSLKQSVYEHLNDVIARDRASEGLWFVVIGDDYRALYHRRGYDCRSVEDLRRQLSYSQLAGKRVVSVLAFDTDKAGAKTEAMLLSLRLQTIEVEAGVDFLAHYVVTGRGESAWWQSATGVD